MSHVIFSCQNNQELVDLSLIASKMKSEMGVTPILYDLQAVTGCALDETIISEFERRYNSINFFDNRFSDLNPFNKIIISVVNALNMLRIIRKENIGLSVIGVPLLTFRILSLLLFGRINQVSYIRGVIAQSGKNTSLSSKVYYHFGFLSRFDFVRKLISDYYSNLVFCIGRTTADFIESRGVSERDICVVGSVYCDSINKSEVFEKKEKEIVFVSSAFSFHGYTEAQHQQQDLVIQIQSFIKIKYGEGIKFKLRVHPRESITDYAEFISNGGVVDAGESLIFEHFQKENTLFLSIVSTLLFEMAYLGYEVEFISGEYFNAIFNDWYDALNVNPVSDWKSLINDFVDDVENKSYTSKKFENVITNINQGTVVDVILREISSRFVF